MGIRNIPTSKLGREHQKRTEVKISLLPPYNQSGAGNPLSLKKTGLNILVM